jgi:prevent-host-death family protein
MMDKVDVDEAKTDFSDLLRRVERGEEFLLCRNGEPVAQLVLHRKRSRIDPDPFLRRVVVKGDLTRPMADGYFEAGERS